MRESSSTDTTVNEVFALIKDFCAGIYYGGSRVDPVIDNPHDYDYICFAKHLQRQNILRALRNNRLRVTRSMIKSQEPKADIHKEHTDFSQIRVYPYTEISWFSYLDVLMKHLIGEEVCPKTDVIHQHRDEFINCLQQKMQELLSGRLRNQKR